MMEPKDIREPIVHYRAGRSMDAGDLGTTAQNVPLEPSICIESPSSAQIGGLCEIHLYILNIICHQDHIVVLFERFRLVVVIFSIHLSDLTCLTMLM